MGGEFPDRNREGRLSVQALTCGTPVSVGDPRVYN